MDNPAKNWHLHGVPEMFQKTIGLRLDGYRDKYPEGVLPVDMTEFVGTHYLLCETRPEGLVPIVGLRSITLDRCQCHFLPFPLLSIATSSHAPKHAEIVQQHIDRCEATHTRLIYWGGFTIHPEIRKDREYTRFLLNLSKGIDFLCHDQGTKPYEIIAAGVIRVKTDQYFHSYGYDFMVDESGHELSPVNSHYLAGEPVRFIHLKQYAENAKEVAETCRELWRDRWVMTDTGSVFEERRAA